MSFISKWVFNMVNEERKKVDDDTMKAQPIGSNSMENEFGKALNISLYNVTGGRIIKFHSFDDKTHTHSNTTYVIHDEDDLEKSLSQLITIEAMK